MFMPETKIGSELLREMRQKNQELAVIIDEHGSVAELQQWKIWWKRSLGRAERR